MERLIRQSWWKIIGALILVGALFVALGTPLSPGILTVESENSDSSSQSVSITGYNSHFKSGESLQVWLQKGDHTYCPTDLKVLDETHIQATWNLPSSLPSNIFSVLVNTDTDGTMVSIDGLYVNGEVNKDVLADQRCYQDISATEHSHFSIPFRTILYESIRNLNFHVPMWFSMIFLTFLSFVSATFYLTQGKSKFDDMTAAAINVGLLFSVCGLATGAFWARFTWGAFWTNDPQLNGAAVSTLIYLAYFLLRRSIPDPDKKARLTAVYAIFAFVMFYVFVKVIPSMADFSLHPDTTDNPSFKDYDIEGKLKIVFRTATAGWIALSFWIFSLKYRLLRLERKRLDDE